MRTASEASLVFRYRWVHPSGAIIGSYFITDASAWALRRFCTDGSSVGVAERGSRREKIASPSPTESSIAMNIMDRRGFLGCGLGVFLRGH